MHGVKLTEEQWHVAAVGDISFRALAVAVDIVGAAGGKDAGHGNHWGNGHPQPTVRQPLNLDILSKLQAAQALLDPLGVDPRQRFLAAGNPPPPEKPFDLGADVAPGLRVAVYNNLHPGTPLPGRHIVSYEQGEAEVDGENHRQQAAYYTGFSHFANYFFAVSRLLFRGFSGSLGDSRKEVGYVARPGCQQNVKVSVFYFIYQAVIRN